MKNNNISSLRMRMRPLPMIAALALAFAGISASPAGRADTGFDGSNTIAGLVSSNAYGVSADGSVVTGTFNFASGGGHPYILINGVMTDLTPSLPAGQGYGVLGISADGNVIVGSNSNAGLSAFSYRVNTGTFTLLNASGADSQGVAFAASNDGSTIVGRTCGVSCPEFHAAEWLSGSTTSTLLGTLHPGQTSSTANAVNADGTVAVGYAITHPVASDIQRAAYWLNGTAFDLGTIGSAPGQFFTDDFGVANGVSPDGTLVVGGSSVTTGGLQHATLWNVTTPSAPVATDLGALNPNSNSVAYGISGNGSVVVGQSDFPSNTVSSQAAFRWTQATGMLSVVQWLASAGVTLPAGWELATARATNQDGTVVVGNGSIGGQSQGWLARVNAPNSVGNGGNGVIEIDGFNNSLVEAGSGAVRAGLGMVNMAMFGAHHRSILDSGLARSVGGNCAWATADAIGSGHADTRSQLTEAGVCRDFDSARLGVGIGQAWSQQDWSSGGSAHYSGRYLILEGAKAFDNGLQPSVTAYYGRFNTSLDRHYANGAATDSSDGNPDAYSYAIRARLDWNNVARLGAFDLSPYAAYTWMKTMLDGYTETGGGFPAQFGASNWRSDDLRLGSAARTALSTDTDLRLALEAVHRVDQNGNGVNGQVIGLWSFALPGQSTNQTWARTTIDIDHRIGKSALITFGANLASSGGDPGWGLMAGIRASF